MTCRIRIVGRRLWNRSGPQFVVGLIGAFVVLPFVLTRFHVRFDTAIYLATGIIVLWYTIQTHAMRREMVRQNEIAIQPVIIATLDWRQIAAAPRPSLRKVLVLRNVGRETALFIQVRDLPLTDVTGDRVRFVAKFARVAYLEAAKDVGVAASCTAVDASITAVQLDAIPSLDPTTAIESYEVEIDYQDIAGQAWQTVMQMGERGIRLVRQGKA